MTGLLSSAADDFVLGRIVPAFAAILMLIAFVWGAACTALMVNYAKRNFMRYVYAPVLFLEAILLLVFGMVGRGLLQHEMVTVTFTAILLCYVMGLQNALITKISNAEIRTTHVTGLVTDIGIEIGKLIYWNRTLEHGAENKVSANRSKLILHCSLVLAFFVGALIGAAGFKYLGFISTIPLAAILITLALAPAVAD
jgi:uncharacterized membrane protein YoaK (UPF0700 family)